MSGGLPRVLFFNINGNGLGHLSRCLAYARRLKGRAEGVFFSLASAVEIINDLGFSADYFVSEYWSDSHISAWNRELAVRVGLMLEEVRPDAVVFDGTWPFHGFMDACQTRKVPLRIWSNRGLHKKDFAPVPVSESEFDLVIRPGELGAGFDVEKAARPGRKVSTPPVTLLRDDELMDREAARQALGLDAQGRYALLSLGPGNLKRVDDLAAGLIDELQSRGFEIVWAKAPITVDDVALPDSVRPISVYPLVRYMRAFDVFAGAAGYNTCCEVVQSGVPSLIVPNTMVADDQTSRAMMLAAHAPVVVSACESAAARRDAVTDLLDLSASPRPGSKLDLGGADYVAGEILSLVDGRGAA